MKTRILTSLMMFVIVACSARETYTMSRTDFINQFSGKVTANKRTSLLGTATTYSVGKIYCYDENNKKVLFAYNSNTQLKLQLNDNSSKRLLLHTISFNNDTIQAIEYNVLLPGSKISYFDINDVKSFSIENKYREQVLPYFNSDSSCAVARLKNDSLERSYSKGNELVISLIPEKATGSDTILLRMGACYNIAFKDGNQTLYGVINKITKDSIFITSHFSDNMAMLLKQKWAVFEYAINDMAEIRLLKSGGYTTKNIRMEDFYIVVQEKEKQSMGPSVWYAVHPQKGDVNLYRSYLVDGGYKGIREDGGKAIWYEGE